MNSLNQKLADAATSPRPVVPAILNCVPKAPIDASQFAPDTLNLALELSLEWGENWLQPINERILLARPQLAPDDAETLNAWCVEVRTFAFAEVHPWYGREVEDKAERALEGARRRYPKIDEENLSRLYNQGMYYAWRG